MTSEGFVINGNSALIFGGAGFIGAHLANLGLQRGWQTVIADQREPGNPNLTRWSYVDITRRESIEQIIGDERPEVVINVAALADIDRAERERSLAWQINVQGARYVAEVCSRYALRHIFFSSDAVFNGENGPYKEDDDCHPLNYYGLTKAEAENVILSVCPEAIVIRVSLVLGFPIFGGNSFMSGLDEKLKRGTVVTAPTDEARTPIDVITLAECTFDLACLSFSGLIHLGCTQPIDRYSLTSALASRMGYPSSLVVEQISRELIPGRALRHKRGILDVSKAQRVLKFSLPNLETTIQRAISTRETQIRKNQHD